MDNNEFKFDATYVKYWNNIQQDSISNEIRKIEVPSDEIASHYISLLKIKKTHRILDLGCSFGRLYPVISAYSKNIYGVDVNLDAINEAKKFNYIALVKGSAEATNFATEYFNTIICWAVYDVVDQNASLIEENRILIKGGQLLITGKNIKYIKEDNNAFIAERNAKLKSFPNHFTDVYTLIDNINLLGFKVIHAFGFRERGHLAKNIFFSIDMKNRTDFYEYVLILEKICNISDEVKQLVFADEYSDIARMMCKKSGYDNIIDFFIFHKNRFGD